MGILDDAQNAVSGLTDQAKGLVDAVGADKIEGAVDAATDKVDEVTGGASSAITAQIDNAATSALENL
jgi:uncharacterized protein YjbJ (UPF0337 family)